jgi:hypothetical protein
MSSFRKMTATELINAIALTMYEPPLSQRADVEKRKLNELGVALLFLDFDTEVQSGGVLGFLENSAGLLLDQTIEAFEKIGAAQTAKILTEIRTAMTRHGTSPQKLRQDFVGTEEFSVTTFASLHGEKSVEMAREVEAISRTLFTQQSGSEDPHALLDQYVDKHRDAIAWRMESVSR